MLIGLGYRNNVGKSSIAKLLNQEFEFQHISFADSLKKAVGEIFGLNERQMYGDLKETDDDYWKLTPRYIMQRVGTECFRKEFSQDIWIKSLERKRLSFLERGIKRIVVDDVRFVNEAEYIKSVGGILIRVDRSVSDVETGHVSEHELKLYNKWDYVAKNDGELIGCFHGIMNYLEGL